MNLRDSYRAALLGKSTSRASPKARCTCSRPCLRLRQAACHPPLVDKVPTKNRPPSSTCCCPHLDELISEGHKALVFSQFTSMLAIVKKHLDRRGVVYEYLDGQTRDRKERVNRFQTDPNLRHLSDQPQSGRPRAST